MKALIAAILQWLAALLSRKPQESPVSVTSIVEALGLSATSQSLIKAGISLVHNDGAGFIAAFKAHDWKTVAIDVIEAELTLADAAGVPGAGIALKLLPVGMAVLSFAVAHGHNSGENGIGAPPEGGGTVVA